MPHRRAKTELEEHQGCRGQCQVPEHGVGIEKIPFPAQKPTARGHGQDAGHAKKGLSQNRVKNSDLVLVKRHPQATEQSLQANRYKCGHAEVSHPAPLFHDKDRPRENQGHQTNSGSDKPVAVFIKYASHPFRNRKQEHIVAVGCRPVGNRHPDAFRGHDSPAADE